MGPERVFLLVQFGFGEGFVQVFKRHLFKGNHAFELLELEVGAETNALHGTCQQEGAGASWHLPGWLKEDIQQAKSGLTCCLYWAIRALEACTYSAVLLDCGKAEDMVEIFKTMT